MGVNLQRSYSKMNESIIKLFDESGVPRSFTVPYLEGQMTDAHVASVGQAAQQVGGLTNNLLMSAHHSAGKGWGSGDGHTVAYNADKLRRTVIPAKDANAKEAIDAAKAHLTNIEKLTSKDDPAVQTAKGQLGLVEKTDGAGMSLMDFGVLLTQIMYLPHQNLARAHSGNKDGGHAPHLRAPGDMAAPETTQGAQGEAPEEEQAPEAQPGPAAAPAASAAPSAATPAAPAAPVQG